MMSDLGQSFHVLAVRFERNLPGSVERVWQHLTECSELSSWFGNDGVIEPREGGDADATLASLQRQTMAPASVIEGTTAIEQRGQRLRDEFHFE